MSDKDKRILIIVGVTILALAFAFLSTVTGLCWKYFESFFTGQAYYTEKEYNDKFQNEKENYDNLLKQYQENLTNAINDKVNAENQLQIEHSENSRLNIEIENLKKDRTAYQNRLEILQEQYNSSVQTSQAQVQAIIDLSNKIVEIDSQIVQMTIQISENENLISSLNYKISQLQSSIQSYETFITELVPEEKVIAKFDFDGAIINLQLVVKGAYASISDPSTTYVRLNYWEVEGSQVTLSEYQVKENTTFTANVTYRYDVKFVSETQAVKTEIVSNNEYATKPEEDPVKEGYKFKGWSVNGIDVIEVSSYKITQHTTFIAVFEKIIQTFDVLFYDDSSLLDTKHVNENLYVDEQPKVEEKEGFIFLGWSIDKNNLVDVVSTPIIGRTVFYTVWVSKTEICSSMISRLSQLNLSYSDLSFVSYYSQQRVMFFKSSKNGNADYYIYKVTFELNSDDSFVITSKTQFLNSFTTVEIEIFYDAFSYISNSSVVKPAVVEKIKSTATSKYIEEASVTNVQFYIKEVTNDIDSFDGHDYCEMLVHPTVLFYCNEGTYIEERKTAWAYGSLDGYSGDLIDLAFLAFAKEFGLNLSIPNTEGLDSSDGVVKSSILYTTKTF